MTDHADLLDDLEGLDHGRTYRGLGADAAAAIRELLREREELENQLRGWRAELNAEFTKAAALDAILAALRREGWDDPERTLAVYEYSIHDILRANGWCDPARYEELRALAEKGMALDALEAWLRAPAYEEHTAHCSVQCAGVGRDGSHIAVEIRRFLLPSCDLAQHDVGRGPDLASAIRAALERARE